MAGTQPAAAPEGDDDGTMGTVDVPKSGSVPDSSQSYSSEKLPFQNWSHYKIVAFLGAGGMGAVYKARDPRLGRTVAVKFLRSGQADTFDTRQRRHFEREARAQARIEHPHICKMSGGCRNSDGIA